MTIAVDAAPADLGGPIKQVTIFAERGPAPRRLPNLVARLT